MTEVPLGDLQEHSGQVAPHVYLHDVRLVNSRVVTGEFIGEAELFVLTDVTTTARQDGESMVVLSSYALRAQRWDPEVDAADDDGELTFAPDANEEVAVPEDDPAWDIKVTFAATYFVRPGLEPFTEEQLKAFTFMTGAMSIHPYAREYVQTTTSRLGYPAFTMPLMRRPGDSGGPGDMPIDVSEAGGGIR